MFEFITSSENMLLVKDIPFHTLIRQLLEVDKMYTAQKKKRR